MFQSSRSVFALAIAISFTCLPSHAAQLAGSEWAPEGKPERFVQFGDKGAVSGFGACNRFFGSYSIIGNRIKIGPLGSTRKACARSMMVAEQDFLVGLQNAVKFERRNSKLKLKNAQGVLLMILSHRDFD